MNRRSAGILLFRRRDPEVELLIGHPGGPYWTRKDEGAWSIPKGEIMEGEEALAAAHREFREEVGTDAPSGPILPLGEAVQPSRKVVTAYAVEGDFDPRALRSISFELEWPPRSGRVRAYPEIDRVAWFSADAARRKLLRGQAVFVDRLLAALAAPLSP